MSVEEENPPRPFVSSHSLESAVSKSEQVSLSKAIIRQESTKNFSKKRAGNQRPKFFKDFKVATLRCGPERLAKMAAQIIHQPIIVQKGIVDVEQRDNLGSFHARSCFFMRG
jgi:hypothetical protein